MTNAQAQLNHARATLQGTLLQLDYLQELVNETAMRDSQRAKISQQVHNIRVNSQGAMRQLSSVYDVPWLGMTK
ncbi:hypothetical protein [Lactiplantibacillus plantarum]|uniref:hypothetical protein n=1 Tax=Lactiplantibacillus plantarum TaxID=1590 RepID=UPI00077E1B9E|nr:hypothetical protein [Lactiplantibacillus plantarum]AMR18562.1 hypothetical protein AZF39_00559 [Lactiplantibacillus plantarum]MDB7771009.1 hypothetical protein [Lactiplantibacillus plantarum]MDN7027304.1 hypothetical protein [Lactiplantibacillus plantarum]QIA85659.1 hypothetical protein FEE41_10745 [Lactiplantibacillus plantarum]QTL11163.1 hypothetical protein J7V10_11935 [Lactiplantibacillus plantarum]